MENLYSLAQKISEEALQVYIIINYNTENYTLAFEDICEKAKKSKKQMYRIYKELAEEGLLSSIPKSRKKLGRDEKFYETVKEDKNDTQVYTRPIAKTGGGLYAGRSK